MITCIKIGNKNKKANDPILKLGKNKIKQGKNKIGQNVKTIYRQQVSTQKMLNIIGHQGNAKG